MQQLTLQKVFGRSASQTNTHLIINKADLPKLTPTTNNQAQGLLVALILKANEEFEGQVVEDQGETLVDEQGVEITYSYLDDYEKLNLAFWRCEFIFRNKQTYRLNTFVIDIYKIAPTDSDVLITPNDLA